MDLLLCFEIETHHLPVLFTAEALSLIVHTQHASHSANHKRNDILSSFLTSKIHTTIQNNANIRNSVIY